MVGYPIITEMIVILKFNITDESFIPTHEDRWSSSQSLFYVLYTFIELLSPELIRTLIAYYHSGSNVNEFKRF